MSLRVWSVAAGVVVLVAGIAAVVAVERFGSSGHHPPPGVAVRVNSVAIVDPRTGLVVRDVRAGLEPVAIAVGSDAVWVANEGENTLTRIGLKTMQPTTVGIGGSPAAITANRNEVWAFDTATGTILQIDQQQRSERELRLKACEHGVSVFAACNRGGIAAGYGRLWLTDGNAGVYELNPATGVATRIARDLPAHAVAVAKNRVYTSDASHIAGFLHNDVAVVSQQSVSNTSSVHPTLGIDPTRNAVWVVSPDQGQLGKWDPTTLVPNAQRHLALTLNAVTSAAGWLWITAEGNGTLLQVNPDTLAIHDTIHLGHAPTAIAYAAGKLWVTVQDPQTAINQE